MKTVKKVAKKETPQTEKVGATNTIENLTSQIKYFNRMANLSKVRGKFIETKDELEALEFKNSESLESFENQESLKLVLKQGYNNDVFSVSNEFILSEFKTFMIEKINSKIAQIDAEILK